ncbi:DUF72 domain-containing protein [Candidatus Bathyarchaeota archaeon]|nr:DUF72 domain-containing protein [Candidatus Bathyarchaeota archaeon]
MEILVGTGGWSYFNVQGDRLQAYARAFKTVEVNSTYYRIPSLPTVESWRKRVPEDFEFTVRCNRELIRKLRIDPLDSSLALYHVMRGICEVLKARIIHIQTPSSFDLDDTSLERMDDFLSAINPSNPRFVWEVRSSPSKKQEKMLKILKDHDVIRSVDLSRETPFFDDDIIYSRLFGKGDHNIYQFTNTELKEIDGKAKATRASKAYLNFHGTRMYKDAARISVYEATGRSPKVTGGIGVDSVIEVLREDAHFPSTTSELVRSQGWKVCEWNDDQQLRLSEILDRIEEKRFGSINELGRELRKHGS